MDEYQNSTGNYYTTPVGYSASMGFYSTDTSVFDVGPDPQHYQAISIAAGDGSSNGGSAYLEYTEFLRQGAYDPESSSCSIEQASGPAEAPVQVQVPTASINGTSPSDNFGNFQNPYCPTGMAGWYRQLVRYIVDQKGQNIKAVMQWHEQVTVDPGKDGLNFGQITTQSGSATGNNGGYHDELRFCSNVCPSSYSTTQATQAQQVDYNGVTYQLAPNKFEYSCRGNTINGN